MVSVNPNPAQGFYFFDPINMGVRGGLQSLPATADTVTVVNMAVATNTKSVTEDSGKKSRKPYTITKSRETWTDQEHDKFLEALQLFDRDWKKIEAFVGSKTVIQIRSHAQKYFLKVQKNGANEHVPPPRPKRKALHPYPQKVPKHGEPDPATSQAGGLFHSSSVMVKPGGMYQCDSSSLLENPIASTPVSSWSYNSVPPVSISSMTKDDTDLLVPAVRHTYHYSNSNESAERIWTSDEPVDQGDHGKSTSAIPDFAEVYRFIGSIFDPNTSGHFEKLKQMDGINLETALLLMKNLTINLTSPEFEDHKRLLSSHDTNFDRDSHNTYDNLSADKSEYVVPTAQHVKGRNLI